MIIYLFDQQKTDIPFYLDKGDIELWQKPEDAGNIENWNQRGINPLEKVDGIILEISRNTSQTNYLLAQCILLQKNTLCIYKTTHKPRKLLNYLKNKNVPKCIRMQSYTKKHLREIAIKFVKDIQPGVKFTEVPNIKYTLRITDMIEKYLNWKSKKEKINKADFIRSIIKKAAKKDQEYKDWLNNLR